MYRASEDRIDAACNLVRRLLIAWGNDAVQPLQLEAAICILIAAKGGQAFIAAHPRLRSEPVPPYHAASYRPSDMSEYNATFEFVYEEIRLYMTPDFAQFYLL